jgi:flavin reductase (DIM6/NTAB) family NADH-FMN oxidoreductase RutF
LVSSVLLPNCDIWATRIQTVSALLTASADRRDDVYYLATVCQVGVEPPLLSVSPNPEYPICATIEAAGYFGLALLAEHHDDVVQRCIAMDKNAPDKLDRLRLRFERTVTGTPLLLDCLQAIECRVERAIETGDHRCVVGRVTERRIRAAYDGQPPHRFGGAVPAWKRWAKWIVYRSRLYDVVAMLSGKTRGVPSLEAGTRRQMLGDDAAGHSP